MKGLPGNDLNIGQCNRRWTICGGSGLYVQLFRRGKLLLLTGSTLNRTSTAMNDRREDGDWIGDLVSENASLRDDAISDLRDMLLRGLSKSLSRIGRVDDAFLEDVVQDASMKVLGKLDQFEGRSRFRTWAVTIAVRTAISTMRKRDWQDVSLDSFTRDAEFSPQDVIDSSESSDRTTCRLEMLSKLKELIDSELSARQWTALTAELGGMPLPKIAEEIGSNTNSLYKMLHDARKKLRNGLEAAGYTIDDVRQAWA